MSHASTPPFGEFVASKVPRQEAGRGGTVHNGMYNDWIQFWTEKGCIHRALAEACVTEMAKRLTSSYD